MKQAALAAYACMLLTFSMLLYTKDEPAGLHPAEETQPPLFTPAIEVQNEEAYNIRLIADGQERELDLENYLIGVVAAEMPAGFEEEALKAQAVAARTYAIYCMDTHKHSQYDLCGSAACCQAWQSDETLRAKWGSDYERNLKRIESAVSSTCAQTLGYEGKAIFAAFHSSSAGATESSGEIWANLPYLTSVPSPEDEQTVPNYISTVCETAEDFRSRISKARPDADFSLREVQWLEACEADPSGRVACMTIAGKEFSGRELREIFSLRSTAFSLDYSDGNFIFTVTGSGHGVGMSQYGANVMASQGYGYREILAHYYPGTDLLF